MTFHHHDGSAGPARLPNSMTIAEEFSALMDLRERTTRRLMVLADLLDDEPRPTALPRSGLVQAAAGVLLFKGGRHA